PRVRDVPAGRDRAGNHGTRDRRHRQRSERARAGCARPPARRIRLGARYRARRLSEPRRDGLESMMTNADAIEIGRAAGVDEGVGEALSREALRLAVEKGARTVELTSRPSRAAANRLYRRLGFVERETSVYRYTLSPAARP